MMSDSEINQLTKELSLMGYNVSKEYVVLMIESFEKIGAMFSELCEALNKAFTEAGESLSEKLKNFKEWNDELIEPLPIYTENRLKPPLNIEPKYRIMSDTRKEIRKYVRGHRY